MGKFRQRRQRIKARKLGRRANRAQAKVDARAAESQIENLDPSSRIEDISESTSPDSLYAEAEVVVDATSTDLASDEVGLVEEQILVNQQAASANLLAALEDSDFGKDIEQDSFAIGLEFLQRNASEADRLTEDEDYVGYVAALETMSKDQDLGVDELQMLLRALATLTAAGRVNSVKGQAELHKRIASVKMVLSTRVAGLEASSEILAKNIDKSFSALEDAGIAPSGSILKDFSRGAIHVKRPFGEGNYRVDTNGLIMGEAIARTRRSYEMPGVEGEDFLGATLSSLNPTGAREVRHAEITGLTSKGTWLRRGGNRLQFFAMPLAAVNGSGVQELDGPIQILFETHVPVAATKSEQESIVNGILAFFACHSGMLTAWDGQPGVMPTSVLDLSASAPVAAEIADFVARMASAGSWDDVAAFWQPIQTSDHDLVAVAIKSTEDLEARAPRTFRAMDLESLGTVGYVGVLQSFGRWYTTALSAFPEFIKRAIRVSNRSDFHFGLPRGDDAEEE